MHVIIFEWTSQIWCMSNILLRGICIVCFSVSRCHVFLNAIQINWQASKVKTLFTIIKLKCFKCNLMAWHAIMAFRWNMNLLSLYWFILIFPVFYTHGTPYTWAHFNTIDTGGPQKSHWSFSLRSKNYETLLICYISHKTDITFNTISTGTTSGRLNERGTFSLPHIKCCLILKVAGCCSSKWLSYSQLAIIFYDIE